MLIAEEEYRADESPAKSGIARIRCISALKEMAGRHQRSSMTGNSTEQTHWIRSRSEVSRAASTFDDRFLLSLAARQVVRDPDEESCLVSIDLRVAGVA